MFAPLRCHWYDSGAAPEAATVNVADWPTATVRFDGCDVMLGGAFA